MYKSIAKLTHLNSLRLMDCLIRQSHNYYLVKHSDYLLALFYGEIWGSPLLVPSALAGSSGVQLMAVDAVVIENLLLVLYQFLSTDYWSLI